MSSVFEPCVDCGRLRNVVLPGCPHCADRTKNKRCLICKQYWPKGADGCSACGSDEPELVEHGGTQYQQCGTREASTDNDHVPTDEGKTPFQYISPIVLGLKGQLNACAKQKYGDARNWEKGFDWLSVFDSMMRHIIEWRMGGDVDQESGLHHMLHAGWACDALVHYFYTATGNDDREGYNEDLVEDFKLTDMFNNVGATSDNSFFRVATKVVTGKIKKSHLADTRNYYDGYTVVFKVPDENMVPHSFSIDDYSLTKDLKWKRTRKGNIKIRFDRSDMGGLTSVFDEDPTFMVTLANE